MICLECGQPFNGVAAANYPPEGESMNIVICAICGHMMGVGRRGIRELTICETIGAYLDPELHKALAMVGKNRMM